MPFKKIRINFKTVKGTKMYSLFIDSVDLDIVKVIYAKGKALSNLPKTRYKSHINVVPRVPYIISIEVLQPSKTTSTPVVTDIMMDNFHVGDCTPDGDTYDCTFFFCKTTEKGPITSETGTIDVSMEFKDHSWKCNCDMNGIERQSRNCKQRQEISPTRLPMVAVARIKLERQSSSNNSGNNMY